MAQFETLECALYNPSMFCFDVLMDLNDGLVWLPIAGLKYQSFPGDPGAFGLPAVATVGGIIRTNWRLPG